MSCKKCGKRTTRSRLCVDCGRDEQRADVDYSDRWEDYQCPTCGKMESMVDGRDCWMCQSDRYRLADGEHVLVAEPERDELFGGSA